MTESDAQAGPFERLLAAGVLRDQPDRSDLVGTCPICRGEIVAPVIGDGAAPRVYCANGCESDAIVAAATVSADAAFLTETLDLSADPVVSAKRYGRHLTTPAELILRSGRTIRLDELRDVTKPSILGAAVRSYTDGQASPPPISGADAQQVLSAFLRLCGAIETSEDVDQAATWMSQFLSRHRVITGTLTDPDAYWQAVNELRSIDYDPTILLGSGLNEPAVLVDTVTGQRFVRCTDVTLYIRRRLGESITPQRLRAEMKRAGYDFRELQKWEPGAERGNGRSSVRVHVYVLPPGEGEVAPYPRVDLERAHDPASPSPHGGDTEGYGDTDRAVTA